MSNVNHFGFLAKPMATFFTWSEAILQTESDGCGVKTTGCYRLLISAIPCYSIALALKSSRTGMNNIETTLTLHNTKGIFANKYNCQWWQVLVDVFVVVCGYVELILSELVARWIESFTVLRILRVMRIVRLSRLLRKTRALRELQKLVRMMATCLKALLWSFEAQIEIIN